MDGITDVAALELLRLYPERYRTLAELRALANSVSVADSRGGSAGRVTVLFGGQVTPSLTGDVLTGGNLVDLLLEQGEDIRTLRTTYSAEFNNSNELLEAISSITGESLEAIRGDNGIRTALGNQFLGLYAVSWEA